MDTTTCDAHHNSSSSSASSTPTGTPSSTTNSVPTPPPEHHQQQQQQQPPQLPQDIPIQYIVDQLHRLGPFYWHKPETTDCTIQVPIDQRRLSRAPNFDYPSGFNVGSGVAHNHLDIRRGSAPVSSQTNPTPKTFTTLKLHQFYLTTQSSLLRALFSGSSVIGLVSPRNSTLPPSSTAVDVGGNGGPYAVPLNLNVQGIGGRRDSTPSLARIPRLLPSSAHHPTLYLPLPDPTSFPHIVHYLYFGTPTLMEEALVMGRIRWDGVVRNVEYLGIYEEEERQDGQDGQQDGQGQGQMGLGGGRIGIRKWLMAWRERQRRRGASHVTSQQQQQQHVHVTSQHQQSSSSSSSSYAVPRVSSSASGSSFMDPILVEESSEGSMTTSSSSSSSSSSNSGMTDSEDDDDMDYDEDEDEDEEDEDEDETGPSWSSGTESEWDPMVLAIAGMKMADPFALDLAGYANARDRAAAAAAAAAAAGTATNGNGSGRGPMEESVDPLQG